MARRKRRREKDELVKRAARAEKLAHLGELSAARQALEGDAVAPGTLRTQAALMDPSRRPPVPREPLPEDLNLFEPEEPFELDFDRYALNIRSARRGAAGGPSGMTAEHLRPLLENDRDIAKVCDFASIMARGEVPDRIEPAVRLGRITTLQQPDGGVRGIVVSDFLRRAVARTMAHQVSKEVEEATAPFQYALKTKSGCECVSHVLQTLTQSSPRCAVVSVDGVGAFDLVSRNAMLRGLMSLSSGGRLLPFVRRFYGQPSVFFWEDETGEVQHIQQGEGGEQGDPLVPLLFCLAQHHALVAANERLEAGEHLSAYLDDLYTSCEDPDRISEAHSALGEELERHANISIHHGKTKVWNSGSLEPAGCQALQGCTRGG